MPGPKGPRIPRPQLRLGSRLTPAVTWLLAINVATFLLFAFSGDAAKSQLVRWLMLTPSSILDGHVWKLVTTTFFTTGALAIFLNILILVMSMPFLEREWGTRRFLIFAAITSVVGNVVAVGVGLLIGPPHSLLPITGMSPFVLAALVAFGVVYGDRPVQFFGVVPMKGRTLAIGIAVVVVIAALVNASWTEGAANVAAMITAIFMTSRNITPRLWLLRWRRARLRKRYTVLDGGAPEKKQWLN